MPAYFFPYTFRLLQKKYYILCFYDFNSLMKFNLFLMICFQYKEILLNALTSVTHFIVLKLMITDRQTIMQSDENKMCENT